MAFVLCLLGTPAFAAEPAAVEHFEKVIRPLLLNHCNKCHNDSKPKGGLKLTSRASLLKGGDSGPSVVPGKPAESLLLKAVKYREESLQMPPSGKIPDADIAALERQYDTYLEGRERPSLLATDVSELPSAEEIGAEFEQFLRTIDDEDSQGA